jgi:hypothetical protein
MANSRRVKVVLGNSGVLGIEVVTYLPDMLFPL